MKKVLLLSLLFIIGCVILAVDIKGTSCTRIKGYERNVLNQHVYRKEIFKAYETCLNRTTIVATSQNPEDKRVAQCLENAQKLFGAYVADEYTIYIGDADAKLKRCKLI